VSECVTSIPAKNINVPRAFQTSPSKRNLNDRLKLLVDDRRMHKLSVALCKANPWVVERLEDSELERLWAPGTSIANKILNGLAA
jgi:hypothetical protein